MAASVWPERTSTPPWRATSGKMWPGRTNQQKRDLAKAITEAVVDIGKAPADQTFVIFEDVAKENWAQAGTLASDE